MAEKKTKHSALLGLAFEGRRVLAVRMKRAGSQAEVQSTQALRLDLDPMGDDPQLVGEALKKALREHKLHEKHCVVGVPLSWALTHSFDMPELSDEDRQSYIDLEAERVFPMPPHELSLSLTRSGQANVSTLAALPLEHVDRLRTILNQADIRPISITLGVAALADLQPSIEAWIAASDQGMDFVFAEKGKPTLLRHLNDSPLDEDGLDTVNVWRELRISLSRLAEMTPHAPRAFQVIGQRNAVQTVIEDLGARARQQGIELQPGPDTMNGCIRPGGDLRGFEPAVAMTAAVLTGRTATFEFLPPRISPFKRVMKRISSRGTFSATVIGLGLVAVLGGAYGWQYHTLNSLQDNWSSIEMDVDRVEQLQSNLRAYRPWFEETAPSLDMLMALTEAFPPTGEVWTRSFAVKDMNKVSFTGFARSRADLLKMQERLAAQPGVEDLKVLPLRGDAPAQFSLSYTWNPEGV